MINAANFHFYRANESVQFFSNLAEICVQNNPENLNIGEQVNAIIFHTQTLNANFKADRGSAITAKLMDIDERRDNAYLCLKLIVEGYEYHYDVNKRNAAKDILTIIEKYGSSIMRLNYQSQSSTISNLADELQSKAAYKLELLGVNDVVSELIAANKLFDERFIERMKESAKNQRVALGDLIKEAIISYRQLTSHIMAHATLNPSDAYTSLINQINALIDTYNTTVKLRNSATEATA